MTDPQNGQTRYSGGISLPQLGHGFRAPGALGAGGAGAAAAPVGTAAAGAAAPGGGAAGGRPAGRRGAGAPGVAPPGGRDGGAGGGAVMPARGVPWPCWTFHWLNGVYDGWRFHQSQNAPSL